jgi:hypothetical protein
MSLPKSVGSPVLTNQVSSKEQRIINVGDELICCDGSIIKVHSVDGETFLGSDGIHRYDRDYPLERGRVTGSQSWPPHPKTIAKYHPLTHTKEVLKALSSCPTFTSSTMFSKGKILYNSEELMKQICINLDKIIHYELTNEILSGSFTNELDEEEEI